MLAAALLGSSSALAATPAQPVVAGSVTDSVNMSGALATAISGHYAYTVAYWSGRVVAVDISNPKTPTIVGYTPSTTALTDGSTINISGNYAFVVSKNRNGPCQPGPIPSCSSGSNDDGTGNSLTVVDISNPTSPTIVGSVTDPNKLFGAYGVAVSGHYAYVAYQGLLTGQPAQPDTSFGGFSVIDINNLGAGVVANIDNGPEVGGKNWLWHVTSVSISGHYAYLTGFSDKRLTVVDISNPLAPKLLTSVRDATNLLDAADVAVQGNYAYVADQNPASTPSSPTVQFTIVNVSNPAKPVVVSELSSAVLAGAYRVRVRGNFAYVAGSGGNSVGAIDISNPNSPRLAGYVQNTTQLYNTDGLDVDPTGRYVVSNAPMQSGQAKQTWPLFPLTPGGPTNTGTVNVIDMVPSPIAVTINPASTPANPTTSTSASFSFSVSDAVSTVQCSLDGAPLGNCTSPTSQTYSGLATGSHTFTVQAGAADGTTASASYTWTVGTAPAYSSPPTITGSTSPGGQLTAGAGPWTGYPSPTLSYQWQRCDVNGLNCAPISGATSSTYAVGPGDVGSTLAVAVTGTNSLGSATSVSPVTAVISSAPTVGTLPSVSGQATVGSQLTGSPGTWSGYPTPSLADQWLRCDINGLNCTAITNATGTTYTAVAADAGSTLIFQVTGSNSAGSSQASSSPTAAVTQAPQNSTPPGLSGSPTPGQTLTATPGSWTGYPAPTVSYQWQQCDQQGLNCNPISGATGSTYVVQSTDGGFTLEALVTATNSAGSAPMATPASNVVGQGPTYSAPPSVTGQATVGGQLNGSVGSWSGSPAPTLAYQWLQCDQTGHSCSAISGATGTTYTPVAADAGSTLIFQVTASNSSGTTQVGSPATAIVTQAPQNSTLPGLSGSPTPGQTLTATPGTWTGYPTPTVSYQWQQCDQHGLNCSPISGATGSTYVVQSTDGGFTLDVVVTATNSVGMLPLAPPPTAVVTQGPTYSAPPSVTGQATVGGQLTGAAGSWSGSPTPTLAYQWQRCDVNGQNCTAITNATGTTYTPVAADAGLTLIFQVTGSNSVGSTQASSAPTAAVTQAPSGNGLPVITGPVTLGQPAIASTGSWTGYPAPSLAFQWLQCNASGNNCTPISGAMSAGYTPQPGDVGLTLAVTVTATNSAGSASQTSQPTAAVTAAPTVATPTVSGTVALGQTLTATPGTTTGTPTPTVTYQWQRCNQSGQSCSAISGATGTTYTIAAADAGSTLVFQVTATNSAGTAQAGSQPTTVVSGAPVNTSPPTLTGSITLGGTVTASPGQWSGNPAPTFTYAWQRCNTSTAHCATISGATASTYVATRAEVGFAIGVIVTATNSLGSSSAPQVQTAIVTGPPLNTYPMVVSGTVATGNVVTSTTGTWSGYPTVVLSSFQWIRCNSTGISCVNIPGATSTSYTVTSADLGSTLRFTLWATNSLGSVFSRSAQTTQINFSGMLHGTVTPTPTLSLGVVAPKAAPLSQVTIAPSADVSFVIERNHHIKGLAVTDGHGRRLAYTAHIVRGSLVIALARRTATLRVVVGNREIVLSRRVSQRLRGKRSTVVPITISYSEAGHKTQKLILKLKAT